MERVDINRSLRGTAFQLLSGVGLSATSLFLAIPVLPDIAPGSLPQILGWLGVAFFAPLTAIAAWRASTHRGPVVTLSPDGIWDRRLSGSFIPWFAISRITTWDINRQKIMVLDLDPEIEPQLGLELTRIARWSRPANRVIGFEGLCVAVAELNVSYDDLIGQTLDFWHRHYREASEPPGPSD